MKQVFTLLLLFALSVASAQAVMNRNEVDCNGQQMAIHQILGSGKALIISSQGLDCSICVSKASGWGNWASANKGSVAVWGAMTYTYSNNTPSCGSLNSWMSTHGWNDIFTFVDSAEYYFQSGTPRYLVYDPADSSLIYQGGNENQARNFALGASQINLGQAQFKLEDLDFFINRGQLNFRNVPPGRTLIEIYNLAGKKEKSFQLSESHKVLNISDLPKGIYLVRMSGIKSALTRKIVIS